MTVEATHVHDATALATWYEQNHRHLPWRETKDPYAIWISETMLQQTRVETVIPYYSAFMERYPTVADLAKSDFEEVAKLWQGLGYYSRARNLHRAAQVVVDEFGGIIPGLESLIRSLPGIGPYTAGAVLSIAFNEPVPAVDGNVLRVMARYLGIDEPIEVSAVKQTITAKVQEWLNITPPAVMTQALMELGATVCIPRSPDCTACPLQKGCIAYATHQQSRLPVRKPKQRRRSVGVYALWCEQDGLVLMHRRPDKGLLAGMWELPAIESPSTTGTAKKAVKSAKKAVKSADLAVPLSKDVENELHDLLQDLWSGTGATTNQQGVMAEFAVAKVREHGPENVQIGAYSDHLLSFAGLAEEKHIFTHIDWHVQVLRPVGIRQYNVIPDAIADGEYRWVAREDLHKLVLPRVYEKLLDDILAKTT